MEKKSKICPNCKTKNSPDAQFCEKCGQALNSVSDNKQRICPACGAENKSGAKFCEKCGTSLDMQGVAQNGGRGNRGFGMAKNRWWLILIPIIAIIIFYLISTISVSSTCASTQCLPGGYYSFAYSNLSSTNTNLSLDFNSNITTTWIVGTAADIDNLFASSSFDTSAFLPSSDYNLSSVAKNIILLGNATSGNINITLPSGNYTLAFWGSGFYADSVNFTLSS